MVVQATNTGFDVQSAQFDLAIPGGGVGAFPSGCKAEWNAPDNGWGEQYGGVSSRSDCSDLPTVLQPGCNFRWDWMMGADNPDVMYERVMCPAELTNKTNCTRNDDGVSPSAAPLSSTANRAASSSRSPTSIPPVGSSTQSLYGQCGGSEWMGPTVCAAGASCARQNDCT